MAAQTVVAAGAKTTLTLVFAWRIPLRNYVGEPLGNFYSEIVPTSGEAAESMASRCDFKAISGSVRCSCGVRLVRD